MTLLKMAHNLEVEPITIHPPISGIETIKREKMNRLKTQKESTLHSVLCAGVEYKTKFKVGDRVKKDCYVNVMVIDGVDEVLTSILNQLHWSVTDEDYLLGKTKTSMAEIVSDDEIRHCL